MTPRGNKNVGPRIQAIRSKLDDWEVECLLIGSPTNRLWLSGFSGSAGWLLITPDRAALMTDFRYWEMVQEQAPAFELVKVTGNADAALSRFLSGIGLARIGIEAHHLTVSLHDRLAQDFDGQLVKLEGAVEAFREQKSADELGLIRQAAGITDRAMAQVPDIARAGMTEVQLAWQLERRMREAGATGLAFDIIVASGPNSARPHHLTGDRALREGDVLIVDMGAEIQGYKSDLTRTFVLGQDPAEKFAEVYGVVNEAVEGTLANLKPGMSGPEADALARQVVVDAGYGQDFGHGLGHGVGLDIHEGPRMSAIAVDHVIRPGNVLTVEPGIYLPGWGGVRLEELIVVNPDGAELISRCPRAPLIV